MHAKCMPLASLVLVALAHNYDFRVVEHRADFQPAAQCLDEVRQTGDIQVVAALRLGHLLINRIEGFKHGLVADPVC